MIGIKMSNISYTDLKETKRYLKIVKQATIPGRTILYTSTRENGKIYKIILLVLATNNNGVLCKVICRGGIRLIKYFSWFELAKYYETRKCIYL